VKKNPGRNGANYKLGNGPIFPSKLSTEWEGEEGFEVTLSLLNVLEPPRPPPSTHTQNYFTREVLGKIRLSRTIKSVSGKEQ
jgi:hypothetical protein